MWKSFYINEAECDVFAQEDVMEADLDKEEVIQSQPPEVCGETLLNTEYLGVSSPSN